MKNKLSKTETKKFIDEFFENISDKTAKSIKDIKKLAMSKNIPLKDKRKLFCKKCLSPYSDFSLRVRNDKVSIKCSNCNHTSRWKVK